MEIAQSSCLSTMPLPNSQQKASLLNPGSVRRPIPRRPRHRRSGCLRSRAGSPCSGITGGIPMRSCLRVRREMGARGAVPSAASPGTPALLTGQHCPRRGTAASRQPASLCHVPASVSKSHHKILHTSLPPNPAVKHSISSPLRRTGPASTATYPPQRSRAMAEGAGAASWQQPPTAGRATGKAPGLLGGGRRREGTAEMLRVLSH